EARRAGFNAVAPQAAFSLPPSAVGDAFGLRLQVEAAMSDAGSRGERALRALRLLCEASGSHEAHLFLVDSDRLERVATLGDELPPPGLADFVQRYLDAEAKDTDTATVVGGQMPMTTSTQGLYELPDGRVYRAVPLATHASHAGIAAIALHGGTSSRSTHTQLAGALAQFLLDTGDCTGSRSSHGSGFGSGSGSGPAS
ncbi:MAG TPA: hypothetical protein VK509_22545, partial [Polyangiales bacterium]|nr:hypothetical protein [Polyangiales bacterium]